MGVLAKCAILIFFQVKTVIETVLVPDFVEVHAQSLAALQAYCPWLAHFQLYSQLPNSTQNSEAFFQAVRSSVELSVSLFQKDTPHRVSLECGNVESRFLIRPTALIVIVSLVSGV